MNYRRETFIPGEVDWITKLSTQSTRFQICHCHDSHVYECSPLPFARFVYIREGYATFTQNRHLVLSGRAHDVLYIPMETAYTSEWAANSSYFVVDVWYFQSFEANSHFENKFCLLYSDTTNVLGTTVDEIFSTFEKGDPFFWLECAAAVTKFFCTIAREKDKNDLISAGIYHSVVYLRSHFDKEVSTAELAQMCSFSESQFRRLFKKHMHMSPTEYRNVLRVRHAEDLMNIHHLSAAQAAESVGFSDVNYFYRLSKKLREQYVPAEGESEE